MAIDRLKILCSKGYFPRELPSAFVTESFGENIRYIIDDWARNGFIPSDYKTNKQFVKRLKHTEPEIFSTPKRNHERRGMHITHPMSQAMLSYVISKNWSTISAWLARSKYSLGKIEVIDNSSRAVPNIPFDRHEIHKQKIESFSTWIVKSDITRFYPSIYTHSIAWAAYGKEKVKKSWSRYTFSLAGQLDFLVRKCNRNQTVGIPIGPDTSQILAGIISSYVDCEVSKNTNITVDRTDRLQDDWLIGCSSLEEAEKDLSKVRITYQKLGLDINGSKTSITHLSEQKHSLWVGQLRYYLNYKNLHGKILSDLCLTAITLQIENPNEKVLNYLLSSFYNKDFNDGDIKVIESFLLKSVVVNPEVTDIVCTLILNYIHEKRPINIDRVIKRFKPFVINALENGWDYEACWGLYLLRGLKTPLEIKDIIDLSKNYEGSIIPIILLDMKEKDVIKKLPKKHWENQIYQSDLENSLWLLAYEGVRQGWLKDKANHVSNHPLCKPMLDRNIVFYDPNRNVSTRKAIIKQRELWQAKKKIFYSFFNQDY